MIPSKGNQVVSSQDLTPKPWQAVEEVLFRCGRLWGDFDREVARWKRENWHGWVPFVLGMAAFFGLSRAIGFGAAYSVVADEPPSDWLSFVFNPATILGRWDVLLMTGSFFIFPFLALLGYRLMRRSVSWMDIAGGWVSGSYALPIYGLFSGCAQAAMALGHFHLATVGVAGMIGSGGFGLWRQFCGIGRGTGTGGGLAFLAGCVGFIASSVTGAFAATVVSPLASCGGDDGEGGGSTASRDALWERWRVANVQIGEKKCSVAFACYPDTAKQGLRGSVEACRQFQKDTIRPSSLPGDFERCVLDSVPSLEDCGAALNAREDGILCQEMTEQTLVFKYAEVPECSSLVAADVKCAVIVPAPKRDNW